LQNQTMILRKVIWLNKSNFTQPMTVFDTPRDFALGIIATQSRGEYN
jgi:hypothetical protein